jgi:ABC-2 type transport system permease protein
MTVSIRLRTDMPSGFTREAIALTSDSRFAGFWPLLRLMLRRDRLRLLAWNVGIVGLAVATTASMKATYGTQVALEQYADLVRNNTAIMIQAGPGYGLDTPTIGSVMMNELSIWTIVLVATMSIFTITRHLRGEEESERADLLRAAPVGHLAPIAAAMAGITIANLSVALGVAFSLGAFGLPMIGALAFGSTLVGVGLVFAGVGCVSSQLTGSRRAALGIGVALIAASFVMRAVGDVTDGPLSWLSPIGWAQAIRAFADERWSVLVLPLAATAGLVGGAAHLQQRRDLGSGLFAQRGGPAIAAPSLKSPFALAVRLQRASVAGWAIGVALAGFFYGVVAEQAESIVADSPDLADFFAQSGSGSITDAFLSTAALVVGLVAAAFTISSVHRLRTEENASHADAVLAAATSRRRLVTSHLAVAAVGTIVVMTVAGTFLGAGFALATGDASQIPRLIPALLVMAPAMMVVAGIAVALYGAAPRWAPAAWGVYVIVLTIGLLGAVLNFPRWLMSTSPFEHVPAVPAEPFELIPVLLLCAVAAALAAFGLAAIERRDISCR